jgi:hypothetical protein
MASSIDSTTVRASFLLYTNRQYRLTGQRGSFVQLYLDGVHVVRKVLMKEKRSQLLAKLELLLQRRDLPFRHNVSVAFSIELFLDVSFATFNKNIPPTCCNMRCAELRK